MLHHLSPDIYLHLKIEVPSKYQMLRSAKSRSVNFHLVFLNLRTSPIKRVWLSALYYHWWALHKFMTLHFKISSEWRIKIQNVYFTFDRKAWYSPYSYCHFYWLIVAILNTIHFLGSQDIVIEVGYSKKFNNNTHTILCYVNLNFLILKNCWCFASSLISSWTCLITYSEARPQGWQTRALTTELQ